MKMEVRIMPLLRMASLLFMLLVLVLMAKTFGYGLVIESEACGADHIVYSKFDGHELLKINGYVVDKDWVCHALKSRYGNRCAIGANIRSYCGLSRPLVGSFFEMNRKLLQKEVKEDSTIHDIDQKSLNGVEHGHESLLMSKKMTVAAPGIFVLCCCLLCPCFRARKKESERAVLAKESSSVNSMSSVEMSSEKIPPGPFRVPPSPSRFSNSPKLSRLGSVHLNLSQVIKATHNFSSALQIGEGGFGTVYKAQLQDGQFVAIKRAKREHFESLRTEFSSEVELLAKIDHRNLVKLLGFFDKGNELLIITEYVPNGTLREHLDAGQHGKALDFNQRLEISIDVAHALTYLHLYAEKQIIHRDVKSSNILLTESYRAKVADFGFAKLGSLDPEKTHISTKVKGTIGYLDPEYMRTYQLTPKSDVYSFGVLLIEILSGRRPVELKRPAEERVTLRWAFAKYNEGDVVGMMDPAMEEGVTTEILLKMFGLAIQCAAPIRSDRPDMKSVGEQLWAIRMDYLKSLRRG